MRPTLYIGSSGAAVVQLQTLLNRGSSNFPKLRVDGSFGPLTRARVVEFQVSKGLAPDGIVGPITWAALEGQSQAGPGAPVPPAPGAPPPGATPPGPASPPVVPPGEQSARDAIVALARREYQEFGWHTNTTFGVSNPRLAGMRCADAASRKRQGGSHLYDIFTVTGAPGASRCLTLSPQAEAMYARGVYTAQERNNTDIVSWCGIFALYCHKMAGLRMSPWPLKYSIGRPKAGDELRILQPGEQILPGDIGINEPATRNHHFVVTEVSGNVVSSMDGNAGFLMEIVKKDRQYSASQVRSTGGGFLTPIWEKVL